MLRFISSLNPAFLDLCSVVQIERFSEVLGLCFSWLTLTVLREDDQTEAFRGSKSRNKVSVGEPAEGSLKVSFFFIKVSKTLPPGTLRH